MSWWISLCFVLQLSLMTKMRWSGIGLGDIAVVIWTCFYLLRVDFRGLLKNKLAWFWVCSFCVLVIGTLFCGRLHAKWSEIFRDYAALLLSAFFSMILFQQLWKVENSDKHVRSFLIISAGLSVFYICLALSGFEMVWRPWFANPRFEGLSNSPNQLALLYSIQPLLATKVALTDRRYWALVYLSLSMGFLTGSDAWIFAQTVGMGIFILGYLVRNKKWCQMFVCVGCILAALFSASFFVKNIPSDVRSVDAQSRICERNVNALLAGEPLGHQSAVRIKLWQNGIKAVSLSPLFGCGAGSVFSGINDKPFEGFECHNTYIEWIVSTGVFGAVLLAGLLLVVLRPAVMNRDFYCLALWSVLLSFSCFFYWFRQPFFWFYAVLIYMVSISGQLRPAPDLEGAP